MGIFDTISKVGDGLDGAVDWFGGFATKAMSTYQSVVPPEKTVEKSQNINAYPAPVNVPVGAPAIVPNQANQVADDKIFGLDKKTVIFAGLGIAGLLVVVVALK